MLVCRRAGQIGIVALLTLTASPLHAQSIPSQTAIEPPSSETRPATTTVTGDTGLWFVPTGEVLRSGAWSLSAYYVNVDYQQGFTDVSSWPVTFTAGLRGRAEIFAAWSLVTRIDRDVRPLFFPTGSGAASDPGGVVNEYPFVSRGWSGSQLGDLQIGAGAGISWNFNMKIRNDLGPFGNRTGDLSGFQIRIGYHPGIRVTTSAEPRP